VTASQQRSRWPQAGLGLVAGAAVAVPVASLLDWPVAIAIAVGAALGLVCGAAAAGRQPPDARS
jgi:hypothetical protein